MTPSIQGPGGLPRDPVEGSPAYLTLMHNLCVRRNRLERMEVLRDRLPAAIAEERFWIRDYELRLGLPPTYPPIGPTDGETA